MYLIPGGHWRWNHGEVSKLRRGPGLGGQGHLQGVGGAKARQSWSPAVRRRGTHDVQVSKRNVIRIAREGQDQVNLGGVHDQKEYLGTREGSMLQVCWQRLSTYDYKRSIFRKCRYRMRSWITFIEYIQLQEHSAEIFIAIQREFSSMFRHRYLVTSFHFCR